MRGSCEALRITAVDVLDGPRCGGRLAADVPLDEAYLVGWAEAWDVLDAWNRMRGR